jgi:hypothetical protein
MKVEGVSAKVLMVICKDSAIFWPYEEDLPAMLKSDGDGSSIFGFYIYEILS